MEPKYKLHNRITEASKWKLPLIGLKQKEWGYANCLGKYYHKSRGKIYCLECGHSWKPENGRKLQTCQECGQRLKQIKDYRTRYLEAAYMSVVDVCEGFQVVRIIWVGKRLQINNPANHYAKEVMQHWIDVEGNVTTMTIGVNGMAANCDAWVWGSEMKIKYDGSYNARARHDISPWKTHPQPVILPIFRRNGFRGDFHGLSPREFFKQLLRNTEFETLLKARQSSLLRFCLNRGIYRYWPSVKICIRNKYTVTDAQIWADYIDLLAFFRKDTRSAHYVCPKNLKAEHDRLVAKKRKYQEEHEHQEKHRKIQAANAIFIPERQKFFDIKLTDGEIDIIVLNDVNEFVTEGNEMHHCLFTNGYYKNKDSLILSARKDQQRIETVELSLSQMKVLQSRGRFNSVTDYHDRIINLVHQNIEQIACRI